MVTKALVTGGGGFIGGHLVRRLLCEGIEVTAVDVKPLAQWRQSNPAATNVQADLMKVSACADLVRNAEVVYHLAAEVGGIGYITRHNWRCASSVRVTQNLLDAALQSHVTQCFFFASSACIYPTHLQAPDCRKPLCEDMVFPARPEGGYGWAKLYSELLCEYARSVSLQIRIARLFNVYGPYCDVLEPRAKAPGALCYKFALARRDGTIPVRVWGDGTQVRSFLYIDDCLDAIQAMIHSDFSNPLNVASEEIITISEMVDMLAKVSNVSPCYEFMPEMPTGVGTRIPCIDLARKELDWTPKTTLQDGLRYTFDWISRHAL